MKADATVQDDIPPVHVLEAAQHQERKETEDLLAGFDRPGRSPKAAPKERDFVDYYARKKPGGVESGAGRGQAGAMGARSDAAQGSKPPRQGDVSTVIVPRKSEGMPPWLGWAAVTLGMLLVGGAVAYLATSDARPTAADPTAPSAASAATTITSATAPAQPNDSNIPPPAPLEATPATATAVTVVEPSPSVPTTTVAPPASGARKRDGRSAPSASAAATGAVPPATAGRPTNATDDTRPPPRDDFIRDL